MITHLFNSSVVSGPETLVLPALRKYSSPVSIVFLTESRLYEESQRPIEYAKRLGHQVHSVLVQGRWDATAFRELRRVLDNLGSSLVHAHDVKASIYLHQAKKSKPGFKPFVASTHHGASYRKGKIRLYEEFYVRGFLPHFDLVFCVCEADRLSIIRRGVPENKVKIHPNGAERLYVSPEERTAISEQIRNRWRIQQPLLPFSHEANYLGVVARVSPEKRHDRMLRALSLLPKAPKKPILLCFGEGPETTRLQKLAQQLKIQEQVFWMGYSNTIPQEMAGLDVLLCLSDGEGVPINLLEAGWAGTPILATAVGGIPDLIPSDAFGTLVQKKQSDEAIAQVLNSLLQDTPRQKQIGMAYQNRILSEFSEKAWLKRLEEAYQILL